MCSHTLTLLLNAGCRSGGRLWPTAERIGWCPLTIAILYAKANGSTPHARVIMISHALDRIDHVFSVYGRLFWLQPRAGPASKLRKGPEVIKDVYRMYQDVE